MPNSNAARKRARQSTKRTLRNRVRRERLKKSMRAFNDTLAGKDASAIGEQLRKSVSTVDRMVSKGLIHKRTADRKKARLAKAAQRALA